MRNAPDNELWSAIDRELSGERAVQSLEALWRTARYVDATHLHQTAARLAEMMASSGMRDVEVKEYPADGVTHYGGWVIPQAWTLDDARLEIVAPEVESPILASYEDSPLVVMIQSAPTPPDGVTAPVVRIDAPDRPESWRGRDVRGKIVLVDSSSLRGANLAFRHGALGILCDEPASRAASARIPACARFLNYTIPPWKTNAGFGFGLIPEQGRRLRALLDARGDGNVSLRAQVQSRLEDGTIPLVTGVLPGETAEEVVLTGHLCEPGANDNASGVALSLEIVRTTAALIRKGVISRPKRGIRLCHSVEVRGTNAYVNEEADLSRVVAGLNLDMVAREETCHVFFNGPASISEADRLIVECLTRAREAYPVLSFETHPHGLMDDNVFGEPMIGAPCPGIVQFRDPRWHTAADTMEGISAEVMKAIGVAAAAYALTIAQAEDRESFALTKQAASEETKKDASPLPGVDAAHRARANRLRVQKAIRGYVGCEHLTDEQRDEITATLGFGWGWGAPDWMQHALFLCDGTRTAWDVWRRLHAAGIEVPLERLCSGLEWAVEQGFATSADR